jgi:hypothetical protein
MIKGSMRLMINLGWLSEGSIGSFGDLVFDNHAYTGNFAVSKRNSLVSIRFDRKEDLLKLQSSIVKVERWSDAWSEITLKNGHVFQGQLHVNLEQALSLGILDLSPENEAKLKTLNTALAAKHLAESTYHAAVLEAGAILHEDGSYEDYRSWYEIPGVPGTW